MSHPLTLDELVKTGLWFMAGKVIGDAVIGAREDGIRRKAAEQAAAQQQYEARMAAGEAHRASNAFFVREGARIRAEMDARARIPTAYDIWLNGQNVVSSSTPTPTPMKVTPAPSAASSVLRVALIYIGLLVAVIVLCCTH